MSDPFDAIDAPTAAAEGGYVNNPADPGGETNRGITVAVARQAGYAGRMIDLTAAQAKAIRRKLYWTDPGFDNVASVSVAVARELYDTGVNCGVGIAGQFLQRALNVLNRGGADYADVPVTGKVGPLTVAAMRALFARRAALAEPVLLTALNCLQGARYIQLAEARESLEAFEFGWLENRVGLAAA
jgi:lysozyme family protein